jgi:hypothetical protein
MASDPVFPKNPLDNDVAYSEITGNTSCRPAVLMALDDFHFGQA